MVWSKSTSMKVNTNSKLKDKREAKDMKRTFENISRNKLIMPLQK